MQQPFADNTWSSQTLTEQLLFPIVRLADSFSYQQHIAWLGLHHMPTAPLASLLLRPEPGCSKRWV